MLVTHMKNTCILQIKDFDEGRNEVIALVLFGEITNDETKCHKKGFRIITSPIISRSENEFKTQAGSLYSSEHESGSLIITSNEWYMMREKSLSPNELLTLRLNHFQPIDRSQCSYNTRGCIQ